jgi:hypothetical protein
MPVFRPKFSNFAILKKGRNFASPNSIGPKKKCANKVKQ